MAALPLQITRQDCLGLGFVSGQLIEKVEQGTPGQGWEFPASGPFVYTRASPHPVDLRADVTLLSLSIYVSRFDSDFE